jgi:hypothetical protein
MRIERATVGTRQIEIREKKISEIREEIIPKIEGLFNGLDKLSTKDLVGMFEDKLIDFIPELTLSDIEDGYPSEIERVVEAWLRVNFTGVQKVMKSLLPLAQMGTQRFLSSSAQSLAGDPATSETSTPVI